MLPSKVFAQEVESVVKESVRAGGSDSVTEVEVVQPFASTTVNWYVPIDKPEMAELVCPVLQAY